MSRPILTEADFKNLDLSRCRISKTVGEALADLRKPPTPAAPTKARRDRYRSGAERQYAAHLESQRLAGEIRGWWHEPHNLVVAEDEGGNRVHYRPDFLVWGAEGWWYVEIKGTNPRLRNAGRSKVIMARERYPFLAFRVFRWQKDGEWREIL